MGITDLIDFLAVIYSTHGYFIVFVSNYIETSPLGWLIPGGILVALGGFYSYSGSLSLVGLMIFSTLGTVSSLLTAYYLGNKTGMKIAKKFGQEKNAKRAEILLKRHGAVVLTTSLLANLTRFWISYIAGARHYNIKAFAVYATIASLTWNALLVAIGYLAGAESKKLESSFASLGIVAWVLVFVALGIIYWKADAELKKEKVK